MLLGDPVRKVRVDPDLLQFLLGQGDIHADRFARLFDVHEKRNAVLEIGVAHHLIEGGRIRHRFAHLAHNPDARSGPQPPYP
jgi:hypothetical protein